MPRRLFNEDGTEVHALLRAAMARYGFTFADLTARMNERGFPENERNLRNKVARGQMSATSFLNYLDAMNVDLRFVHGDWHLTRRDHAYAR